MLGVLPFEPAFRTVLFRPVCILAPLTRPFLAAFLFFRSFQLGIDVGTDFSSCGIKLRLRCRESGVEIEAVQIHHLAPRSGEILHELLFGIVLGVDLGEGTQLGV